MFIRECWYRFHLLLLAALMAKAMEPAERLDFIPPAQPCVEHSAECFCALIKRCSRGAGGMLPPADPTHSGLTP